MYDVLLRQAVLEAPALSVGIVRQTLSSYLPFCAGKWDVQSSVILAGGSFKLIAA